MMSAPAHDPRFWTGRRVLVTGATGFVGSRAVHRLAGLGAEVHAAGRRRHHDRPVATAGHSGGTAPGACDGQSSAPGGAAGTGSATITWHIADLTDAAAVLALVESVRPDVVFHFASKVTGSREVACALPVLHANLGAAVALMSAVTSTAPRAKVVLAGSIEEPRGADPTPHSPYAAAKHAASGYARMFARLWDLPVTVLRPAMVYGPGQSDTSKLIPSVIRAMLRRRPPQVTSGLRLVDWVHVDDVVDGFIRAAERDLPPGNGFDLCTGNPVSIRNTVELIGELIPGAPEPAFGSLPDRPLDGPQVGDPGPAAESLGWRPTIALRDGLRCTIDWYATQLRAAGDPT